MARRRRGRVGLALLLACRPAGGQAKMQGVAYSPVPLKTLANGRLTQDDFMATAAEPLWGRSGRGDMGIMRALGANVVRTYGNNPEEDHSAFLDEAARNGMRVVPGLSDYPYIQMSQGCKDTGFDCYGQIKDFYKKNLQRGFLLRDGAYHPALEHVVVVNEPDRMLPGIEEPFSFAKGVVSAVDGMLDAEKEAVVTGRLVNFTVTLTFQKCPACRLHPELLEAPAIRQTLELWNAFHYPEQYGYAPKNDLATFYRTRFLNSFNTQSAAWAVKNEYLPHYRLLFPETPFYIEEYHVADLDPTWNQTAAQERDIAEAMLLLRTEPLLLGLNFFEYQKSTLKASGFELQFGMFALGDNSTATISMFGMRVNIWCLVNADWRGVHMPALVSAAYGGTVVDAARLCAARPPEAPLFEGGSGELRGLKRFFSTHVVLLMLAGLCNVACLMSCVYVGSAPPDESDVWAKRYAVRLRDDARTSLRGVSRLLPDSPL